MQKFKSSCPLMSFRGINPEIAVAKHLPFKTPCHPLLPVYPHSPACSLLSIQSSHQVAVTPVQV